ncbi:succinate dehydrogenase/fumarate reductase flavoprotein subunit [Sphaerotilus hippei]|uniref:Succinate dehydrogenase/fumarate reductase flavoprotein subunit n=1 Tax=Sphaerotilus hippei TaxID=744406 RepID=A0A318HA97_9BURK|nr:FAD-dependent oxidoreductase [Sphaerotilus hippei]PXW97412.1 succinate dehydrogenase/fumarate reductase flavoprotein subunit [Sphaerotilus hippei]
MLLDLNTLPSEGGASLDVLVIGAGAAGLAAALGAALDGARVLLVERTAWVGGTSAWSGGTTWVPGTHHAAAVNPADTLDAARLYLDHAVGERAPRELREAFLQQGAAVVAHLEARSELKLRPYARHPDYLSDLPGATVNGRALEPLPFDGRRLGPLFALLRPPIPEFTVLGGMMVDRTDINHLLGMTRSFASLRHALRLLGRHALDRLGHPRGTRLVMGNALVARLLASLAQHAGVSLLMQSEVGEVQPQADGSSTVMLQSGAVRRQVRVAGGVIWASGGFNRHPRRRAELLPGADEAWCPAAPGHTGAAQEVALRRGAQFDASGLSPAFWAPVSRRRRADGSQAVFPHFLMDRAKPGFITVNQAGRRFLNESTSYHLFALAMQAEHARTPAIPACLICDAEALRRYGMGMVRPGGQGLEPFLADGYLTQGATLDELAQRLGIDAAGLRDSVARFNHLAATGVDSDFHRGETDYQRHLGDASRAGPNPCLGALTQAPFYAVRLYPGDIGACAGLVTDAGARLLDGQGRPLPGLYAVGNDMRSVMGGVYTGPGITLGPGLVFGCLAGRDAARRAGLGQGPATF